MMNGFRSRTGIIKLMKTNHILIAALILIVGCIILVTWSEDVQSLLGWGEPPQSAERDMMKVRGLIQIASTYAAESKSKELPPGLGVLINFPYGLDPYLIFSSFNYDKDTPYDFDTWTEQNKADWINQKIDFVYIKPTGKWEANPKQLRIYTRPEIVKEHEWGVAAFDDGHAQYFKDWQTVVEIHEKYDGNLEAFEKETGRTLE